jgi:hypothetical protein
MKKIILVTGLMLLLAAAPAISQMMGNSRMMGDQGGQPGPQMMEQQVSPPGGQFYNPYMNPNMMSGYGYGMGPQMMGGYGYGMMPNMMGGYGYGMGPQMMGGYGYGMGPSMMGTGQHPCITGGYGYGMGPGMMGYNSPEQYEKQFKEYQQFLDETKDLRKKLHTLKFDYAEARRNPDTRREDLEKLNAEMERTWKQIYENGLPRAK